MIIKAGRPCLPENLLLRDTLYLLQGISGRYIRFSAPDDPDPQHKLVFVDDSVFHDLITSCQFCDPS
jgi:gamma-tubulin complex component 3